MSKTTLQARGHDSPLSSLRLGCWLFRTTQAAQQHSTDQTACTAHSCSHHGVVTAGLISERPGSPSPIATI